MKRFFILCWLLIAPLWSLRVHADLVTCPSYIAKDKSLLRAVNYLKSVEGNYRLGKCSIEIHVCQNIAPDDSPGSLVGDILVTDARGRQSYLQIDFPNAQTDKRQFRIENGRIMFHYEFDDEHPDPVFGKRESVRLEFLKSENKKYLVSFEEGWYTSSDRKSRKNKSVYNWTLCHGRIALAQPQSQPRLQTQNGKVMP